jgi:hypothetical protein
MQVGDLVVPNDGLKGRFAEAVSLIGVVVKVDEYDFEAVLVHWLIDQSEGWEDATCLTVIPSATIDIEKINT